jgi:hypothetical protein
MSRTELDHGAMLAIRLLRRSVLVTEDETELMELAEGMEAAIREGGIGLAIRREMDFEKTLNMPGEFSVREAYGRFPESLAKYASVSHPQEPTRG